MTNEVNVGIGRASGMFYHAPVGTSMPASPFDDLAAAFKEVGYVNEDGPTWTPYGSVEKIKAWSLSVVRTIKTEKGTVVLTVISTNGESLKTVFGAGAVTAATPTAEHGNLVTVTTEDGPYNEPEAFVLIGKDGDDGLMLSCASGVVTKIAEVPFAPTGAIGWNITIEGDWTFVKDDNAILES